MSCESLVNAKKGDRCTPGYTVGLILFKDEPSAIAFATAQLKATWTALADVMPPDNLMYIPLDYDPVEPDIEPVTEDLIGGQTVVVDFNIPASTYSVVGSLASLESIYAEFKSNKDVWGYLVTRKGAIIGAYDTTKENLEAVKLNISATPTYDTPEALSKVHMQVQPYTDIFENKCIVPISFDFSTVDTVKSTYITGGTGSTGDGELSFYLWDLGRIANLDAAESGFVVKDANGDAVAVTGISNVSNYYTLTFASITAQAYTVSYDPSQNSDYIYLPESTITVS